MKKSQAKTADKFDLKLHWSAVKPHPDAPASSSPKRVEEYLDFLEDIAPVKRDDTPVKLYKERFRL
jgi:hypothetical protein